MSRLIIMLAVVLGFSCAVLSSRRRFSGSIVTLHLLERAHVRVCGSGRGQDNVHEKHVCEAQSIWL